MKHSNTILGIISVFYTQTHTRLYIKYLPNTYVGVKKNVNVNLTIKMYLLYFYLFNRISILSQTELYVLRRYMYVAVLNHCSNKLILNFHFIERR